MKMKNLKNFVLGIYILFGNLITNEIIAQVVPPTNVFTGTCNSFSLVFPTGWSRGLSPSGAMTTPDLSNLSGLACTWPWQGCTVALPPNGHTHWIDGAANWYSPNNEYSVEEAITTITGLTAGQSYTINFYISDFGYGGGAFPAPTSVKITVNGVDYIKSFNPPQCDWESESITFTATGSTAPMLIKSGSFIPSGPPHDEDTWQFSIGAVACNAGSVPPTFKQ